MPRPLLPCFFATALTLLAACQAAPPAPPVAMDEAMNEAPATVAPARRATAILRPTYVQGDVWRLLADVVPNTVASIAHMEVKLLEMPGETEADVEDVQPADLLNAITFGNLKPNTSYRVRAFAYDAGENLLNADSPGFTPIEVGADDAPIMDTLTVVLDDKPFAGEATTAGTQITEGVLTHGGVSTPRINQPIDYTTLQNDRISDSAPQDLVFAPNGDMYYVDSQACRVFRRQPGGAVNIDAGTGASVSADSATKLGASFKAPQAIARNGDGDFLVADASAIRVIKAIDGSVDTLAGDGATSGFRDTADGAPLFNTPKGLAVATNGDVYVADTNNHRIRRVTPGGNVTTFAGGGEVGGPGGFFDATGGAARFKGPEGVAFDRFGNLFVADTGNFAIRKITPGGVVTTFAGFAGVTGIADGPTASQVRFRRPAGLAFDHVGHLWIADGDRVRRLNPVTGMPTTVRDAGSGPDFFTLVGLAFGPAPDHELFLADPDGGIAPDEGTIPVLSKP